MAGGEAFSEGNRSIHVNNIVCNGNETAWINCAYNTLERAGECGPFEDAYVACQGTCMLSLSNVVQQSVYSILGRGASSL